MIIDSHMHIGPCFVFGHTTTTEEVLETMEQYGVTASLLLPYPGVHDSKPVHDDIYLATKQYPGRFFGIISINPHCDKNVYLDEVERCVKMGFRAIKLHPFGHACPLTSPDAKKFFEAAEQFDLPMLIHTGVGAPYTHPAVAIPWAQKYPHLKFVLCHSGTYFFSSEALIAAQICPNIYLETSFVPAFRIAQFVAKLGAHRVMFGTDLLADLPSEIVKYTTVLKEPDLSTSLSITAKEVFKLNL